MHIQCLRGFKIRLLESYYGVSSQNLNNELADEKYCKADYADINENSLSMAQNDCKSYENFQHLCNGRQSCSINFFPHFLRECNSNSQYLTVFYECLPGNL
jgi:hypothetical protein